jgi:colicin import membrane protein
MEAEAKETPKAEPAKKEAPKPTPAAAAPPPPPEPPPPKEEPKKEEPKKEEPPKDVALATPPPAPAPPVPAPDEQKKLDEMLKEQERKAEEEKKLEEQRKAEEQKRLEEERKQAELKKQQEAAKRKKEAELKKKREEEKKRKEAEAKKKFDAEKISALLNKMPDKGAPRPSVPLDHQAKNIKGPGLGAPEGRDKQISASEIAILAQIIRSCVQSKWTVLGGGEGAQQTIVKLRLRFNADGTLAAAPVVMNPQSTAAFLAVSDSAIRAAEACQPYPLPAAKYEVWKDIVLNFDPRDMF